MGIHWAKSTCEKLKINADIIDLRTLIPMDKETVFNSIKKTNKVIVLHEDCLTGGIGAEIAALISEECFEHLDAPVFRCASLDTPVPFAADLENQFLPNERFELKLNELINY